MRLRAIKVNGEHGLTIAPGEYFNYDDELAQVFLDCGCAERADDEPDEVAALTPKSETASRKAPSRKSSLSK